MLLKSLIQRISRAQGKPRICFDSDLNPKNFNDTAPNALIVNMAPARRRGIFNQLFNPCAVNFEVDRILGEHLRF